MYSPIVTRIRAENHILGKMMKQHLRKIILKHSAMCKRLNTRIWAINPQIKIKESEKIKLKPTKRITIRIIMKYPRHQIIIVFHLLTLKILSANNPNLTTKLAHYTKTSTILALLPSLILSILTQRKTIPRKANIIQPTNKEKSIILKSILMS